MRKKSDKPREARVSATEASRSFSRLLDQIEEGRRFLVYRHGRDVCSMAPPPAPVPVRRASECLALLRSRPAVLLDDRFGADLREILVGEPPEKTPAWES